MSEVVVLGAGPTGVTAAMLLAAEGHRVTVLERDSGAPVGGAEEIVASWRRPGVNQFRQPHALLPRVREVLEQELPAVLDEITALGARPHNMITGAQALPAIGGPRPGDSRYDTVRARRALLEAALGAVAARTPGLTVRRGVTVTALVPGAERLPGRPHVSGVVTHQGETLPADLVVDAAGRNSAMTKLLGALGGPRPHEERAEAGFLFYGRHFRARDGVLPGPLDWQGFQHPTLAVLPVPGDGDTWGIYFAVSPRDNAMRALKEPEVWDRAIALFPAVAHWSAGERITDVMVMAGTESRRRSLVVDGMPVATGVISIGDAWATTNPIFGMGTAMGLVHAQLLRDATRDVSLDDPEKLAQRFDEDTDSALLPYYRLLQGWDAHRLAEIDAEMRGERYTGGDETWAVATALDAAKLTDPELLRALADLGSVLATPDEVLGRPGLVEKIVAAGRAVPRFPTPGPTRAELLAALGQEEH